MSIGAPGFSPPRPIVGTAPDSYAYVRCTGCRRLLLQIQNQGILIRFGRGPQGAEQWDLDAEPYFPVVGPITPNGGFDAIQWRAMTPAAQLPAGSLQAYAVLTPRI